MMNKKVKSVVQSKKMDETEYLFSSKTNKARLLKAMSNAEKGINLTEINFDDLKKQLKLGQNALLEAISNAILGVVFFVIQ